MGNNYSVERKQISNISNIKSPTYYIYKHQAFALLAFIEFYRIACHWVNIHHPELAIRFSARHTSINQPETQ